LMEITLVEDLLKRRHYSPSSSADFVCTNISGVPFKIISRQY